MTRTLKIEDDKSGATINASHIKNRRWHKWRNKIQIYWNTGNRFSKPAKMKGISVELGLVSSTQRFFFHAYLPRPHPWVKKCHLITLNTKLWLKLNIQTELVQDIGLMTNNCVCTVCKRLKKLLQNQSIKLDLYRSHDETYEGVRG